MMHMRQRMIGNTPSTFGQKKPESATKRAAPQQSEPMGERDKMEKDKEKKKDSAKQASGNR